MSGKSELREKMTTECLFAENINIRIRRSVDGLNRELETAGEDY